MTPISADTQTREDSLARRESLLDNWVTVGEQIAALEAQRAELLAERLDLMATERSLDPGSDEIAFRSLFNEYAAAGHISPTTASKQITDAWGLVRLYPATLRALADGKISRRHADVIVTEAPLLSGHPDAARLRAEYEEKVLPFAEGDTAARTRAHARDVAAVISPETVEERHRRARRERNVGVRPCGDGTAMLSTLQPEMLAYAMYDRLSEMSRGLIEARPKGKRRPRNAALKAIQAEREAALAAQTPSDPEPPAALDEDFAYAMGTPAPWETNPASQPGADTLEPDSPVSADEQAARDEAALRNADLIDDSDVVEAAGLIAEAGLAADSDRVAGLGSTADEGTPMHDGYGPVETDTRSMDELRADILADLVLTGVPTSPEGNLGTALGSIRASVQITLAATTLTGADNRMAEFDGHGPLSPDTARLLAGYASSWDRIFLDPAGMAVATDNYTPTANMKRYLRARDQHCRFPGCRAPVHRCQIDHNHDHAQGGATELCNLAHFCTSHHPLKHPDVDKRDRWSAKQLENGVILWTSPLGRTYGDEPQLRVMFV
ncbi:DUF222 domain-containing protein [Microbacterium sp. A82]|uniref:HNH endonuclease signature motif containing protein n=1 Tax=Microbacterium sp. A82 TaxID=3450452 RepID=UPI003F3B5B48